MRKNSRGKIRTLSGRSTSPMYWKTPSPYDDAFPLLKKANIPRMQLVERKK